VFRFSFFAARSIRHLQHASAAKNENLNPQPNSFNRKPEASAGSAKSVAIPALASGFRLNELMMRPPCAHTATQASTQPTGQQHSDSL
jgi:hypothetical protein